jgi:hypothetical protein
VSRLTEKNGKPLSDDERREQEEQIKKALAKAKARSAAEIEKARREDEAEDAWIKEVPEALEYTFIGEEAINGRPAYVLTCVSRPGYSPKNMRARVLQKMKGKLWIDRADRELVKAEAETFDRVNVGFGILGRVEKGTRFALARRRLADGAWLAEYQYVRFGARIALIKWVGNEITTRLWDHRHRSTLSASR